MTVQSYRQLDVWKVAMELAEAVYRLTGELPADERFGLAAQMRRAGVSVPSNIAEGAGRVGSKEFLHHLSIARGSLAELETQLTLSVRLRLMTRESAVELWNLCERVGKMLSRLVSSLRTKKSA